MLKLITFLTFFLSFHLLSQVWNQKGTNINGAFINDFFGVSNELSADGNTIIIGSEGYDSNGIDKGAVKVFYWNGVNWVQKGQTLIGMANSDFFGHSVSINASGDIIAIGSFLNDAGNIDAGMVRIYEYISNQWQQVGVNLYGSNAYDNFGSSVKLSPSGNVLAIGSPGNDFNGNNSGSVKVFNRIGNSYFQMGQTLYGTFSNDMFGTSVSVNDFYLCIGSPNYFTSTLSGSVNVYNYSSGIWIQVGTTINGENQGDMFGWSVDINNLGNRIVVGAIRNDGNLQLDCGHVRVFENLAGVWTQIGQDINGLNNNDEFGYSVSINNIGDVIGIGAIGNDISGIDSGVSKIFKFVSGNWNYIGQINGESAGDQSGCSVSLDDLGKTIAVGAVFHDFSNLSNTGDSRVFYLCSLSSSSIDTITCSSYSAPSGTVHISSGIFNDTILNAAGCDSIITINLIIKQPTSSSITLNICSNSFTAPDGQAYSQNGTYIAIIPNISGCDSTITINLTLTQPPNVNAGANQTICEGTQITLSGTGATVYNWSNGIINNASFQPSVGTHFYYVTGTNTIGCSDTDTVQIIVNPLPVVSFIGENITGCSPLTFNLINTTPNSLNCNWEVSNGDVLIGCGTVTGVLNQIGCHDITLTTTDNNGCSNSYTAANIICVEALPNASFSVSSNSFSHSGEQVIFTNNSTGANSYLWNFGDSSPISTEDNPTHIFEVGNQDSIIVELIAVSSFGCSDTSYLIIYDTSVSDSIDSDIFIPTGFSPNDDNENDTWEVTGLEKYPNSIISVFNRWGQLLFDGGYGNSVWSGVYQGEILPTGDYYYIVDLGNGTKFNGVVTLKQ